MQANNHYSGLLARSVNHVIIQSGIQAYPITRKTIPPMSHFFGFGIFSYAFGLGALFCFLLFCAPLPSAAS